MSRLKYSDLPPEIREQFGYKEFHKAVRPVTTTIRVHLRNGTQVVYRKKAGVFGQSTRTIDTGRTGGSDASSDAGTTA